MLNNTPKLAEGQITDSATNSLVEYTGVTSCLTFTVLYSDGTASGGHAGMFVRNDLPQKDQRTVEQVVSDLKTQAQGKTIAKVVVAGEIKTWNQNVETLTNSHYHNVDEIMRDLSPNAQVVRYESGDTFNGKGAYMSLSADHHTFEVKDEKGNVVKTISL